MTLCMLLLSACGGAGSKDSPKTADDGQTYPFVTQLPDAQTLKKEYKNIKHDLSPLLQYHFQITIPSAWKILDIVLDEDPPAGDFDEMGVFRQEGEWMNNEEIPPGGEISVSLIHPQNPDQTATDWLDELLPEDIASYELLEQRTIGSGIEEAADYLFHYMDKSTDYVMRVSAFRAGDRIIFISCSDTANGYRDNAHACYVALSSFKLIANPKANPFGM